MDQYDRDPLAVHAMGYARAVNQNVWVYKVRHRTRALQLDFVGYLERFASCIKRIVLILSIKKIDR